jgi:hypothetical protein
MSHFKNTNLIKNKKDNFKNKKTQIKSSECVICFEMCEDIKDNSIYCGKTKNICCRDCKRVLIETKNYNCPLCRSHPIKTPIYNLHKINIHKKNIKKNKSYYKSPKEIRNQRRNSMYYNETFGPNTNRIARQRRNNTLGRRNYNITSTTPNIIIDYIYYHDDDLIEYDEDYIMNMSTQEINQILTGLSL